MVCDICCWAVGERTARGNIVLCCFKLTYFLYVLAVPYFLIWMVVTTKPIDKQIFGPETDPVLLNGSIGNYSKSVLIQPSIANVLSEQLLDCGQEGYVNWNITVIATRSLAGSRMPVILASNAMVGGNLLPPDSKELQWRAVVQPVDFGVNNSLSGPAYETPWLSDVGCRSSMKARPRLIGQDQILVCVSSKSSGAASVEDCDLIKATCRGGMGSWFTSGCEDASRHLKVELVRKGSMVASKCPDRPLQPGGICEAPADASDCSECTKWGCKRPGTKAQELCQEFWTPEECEARNPPGERPRGMPEFKLTIGNPKGRLAENPMSLVGKPVVLFLGDTKDWSVFWSSSIDPPLTALDMEPSMKGEATPAWCFGPRLQNFYMVACLTASSGANERKWSVREPPIVDGPPFNDRCSALEGVCGSTGAAEGRSELPPEWCREDGTVPPERLVGQRIGHRNGEFICFFCGFIFFMVLAHMSTLVTYFGGLFRTNYLSDKESLESRCIRFVSSWEEFARNHKYAMKEVGAIVIWGASKSEERLFVLRNWLGRVAAVPQWDRGSRVFGKVCRCVDVFMDEGHRTGAHLLWEAWIDFLKTRPPREFLEEWSKRLQDFSFDDAKRTRRGQPGDPFKGLNHYYDQQPQDATDALPDVHNPSSSLQPDAVNAEDRFKSTLDGDNVAALRRLVEVFRDENIRENLEPVRPNPLDAKTRDVVLHQEVELNADCAVDYLYVARAREKTTPAVAYRTLAPHHIACLHLPKQRGGDGQDNEGATPSAQDPKRTQLELAEFITLRARQLWTVQQDVTVTEAKREEAPEGAVQSETRVVEANRVWNKLVRATAAEPVPAGDEPADALVPRPGSEELPEDPGAATELVWFERDNENNTWTQWKGKVQRASLSEATVFLPLVSDTKASAWELGRLCTGTITELDKTDEGVEYVRLESLSPLLQWLSHERDFRLLALAERDAVRYPQRSIKLKTALAAPLCGSRGKGGAQNFALMLLKNRGLLHLPESVASAPGPVPNPHVPLRSQDRQAAAGPPQASVAGSSTTAARPGASPLLNPIESFPASVPAVRSDDRDAARHRCQRCQRWLSEFFSRAPSRDTGGRRVLFTIVDARHQLKQDFFQKVLPNFFRRDVVKHPSVEAPDPYRLDPIVAFAQVPQTFAQLAMADDSLDTSNGMMFNMLNLVRNNCGAVTSCGTNCTWQVPAPDDMPEEFFDARTKIEDTATSHRVFLSGRRSMYMNEPCVIGIAKRNARYLGAVARWSEGAVQLFWVTLFGDRDKSMIFMVCYSTLYVLLIFSVLLFFASKSQGTYLFFTDQHAKHISDWMQDPTGSTIHACEGALVWTTIVLVNFMLFELMRCMFSAAPIVRRIVMLDNVTYFWSTCAAFFWVLLNAYMIFSGSLPFIYEIKAWMCWLLFVKVLQYILTYIMKSKGGCTEMAIWRSQQMFFVTAPMHQLSILNGTMSAFSIIWRGTDKSFWDTDNSDQVLFLVKAWLSFIVGSAAAAVLLVALALLVNPWAVSSSMTSATLILVFMAICVFDAFLDVWELTSEVITMSKPGWAGEKPIGCYSVFCWGIRVCWSRSWRLFVTVRHWAWLIRWLMDFGMPIMVLALAHWQGLGVASAFSFLLRL